MTLTKEKHNTQKQRKSPNDERPIKGSNGHVNFDGYQRMPKNGIRFSCNDLCGTRLTGPQRLKQKPNILQNPTPEHTTSTHHINVQ